MANFVDTSINTDLWTNGAIPVSTPNKISTITDMWDDESQPTTSPMRNFYMEKVIFLTGGTGFLGQIYVEKLLR